MWLFVFFPLFCCGVCLGLGLGVVLGVVFYILEGFVFFWFLEIWDFFSSMFSCFSSFFALETSWLELSLGCGGNFFPLERWSVALWSVGF